MSGRSRSGKAQRDRAFRARISVVAARMLLHQGPEIRDAGVEEGGRLRRRRAALRPPPLRFSGAARRIRCLRAGHHVIHVPRSICRLGSRVIIIGVDRKVLAVVVRRRFVGIGKCLSNHAAVVILYFP